MGQVLEEVGQVELLLVGEAERLVDRRGDPSRRGVDVTARDDVPRGARREDAAVRAGVLAVRLSRVGPDGARDEHAARLSQRGAAFGAVNSRWQA